MEIELALLLMIFREIWYIYNICNPVIGEWSLSFADEMSQNMIRIIVSNLANILRHFSPKICLTLLFYHILRCRSGV
jgi:hypothetical protein